MRIQCSLILILVFFCGYTAANNINEKQVESHYKSTINSINSTLRARQIEFKNNPLKLVGYVDETLLPLWAAQKTMKGMLGNKAWSSLTNKEKMALEASFKDTLQRYVQEGFNSYDGQQVEFVKVKFHPKYARGLLTIKVIPNLLPSFNVDLKISQSENGWAIYDALVKGVSYVSLKKEEVRELFKDGGVSAVLSSFASKNAGYVESNQSATSSSTVL